MTAALLCTLAACAYLLFENAALHDALDEARDDLEVARAVEASWPLEVIEPEDQPLASIHDHPAVGRIVSLIAAPDLDDRRLRVVTEDWGGGDAS